MSGFFTNGITAPTAANECLPVPQEAKVPVDTQLASGQTPQSIAPTVQQLLASRFGADAGGESALTYGATLEVDVRKSSYFAMTFGAGNCAMTFTGWTPGQTVRLKLTQDGTGSRLLTPAVAGGSLVTSGTPLSTGASSIDMVEIWSPDGLALFYYPVAKAFS